MTTSTRVLTLIAISVAFLSVMARASNLYINATFDSSLTTPEIAAINTAIQTIENTYSNAITVNIYFQANISGLGQSNFLIYGETYQAYYDALVATNADPAAIAALNANGGDYNTNGGVNPVGSKNEIEIKSANLRAVGINVTPGCNVTPTISGSIIPNDCSGGTDTAGETPSGKMEDGIITLNTNFTFPPNPNNGGYYDLVSTAEHEIDEILGLGSALENVNSSTATETLANDTPFGVGAPEDLFRYTAPTGGVRSNLTVNCAAPASAYFDYGPSTGVINQFNNSCNGGDFGDWAPGGYVQSAFGSPGTGPAYGITEIDALSAIGYGLASPSPEPGTMGLLGASLGTLVFLRRRYLRSASRRFSSF